MELSAIKTYRINDVTVWQAGQPIADLEALINRALPQVGIRRGVDTQPIASAAPVVVAPAKAAPAKGGSKKEAAIEIYRDLITKAGTTKREIIDAFIAKLDMTEAGAMTYYYTARNAIAASN